MADSFGVTVSAGSLRASEPAWTIPHGWTELGVAVEGDGNGATLLHAAVALCVLNDTFREAQALGTPVAGVRVAAAGGFDSESWVSSGITYSVEVDTTATAAQVAEVSARIDEVAEIPRALRAGTTVERADG